MIIKNKINLKRMTYILLYICSISFTMEVKAMDEVVKDLQKCIKQPMRDVCDFIEDELPSVRTVSIYARTLGNLGPLDRMELSWERFKQNLSKHIMRPIMRIIYGLTKRLH